MLTRGNSKLGPDIWGWSIPAITTCPGRSELCEAVCYALRGYYNMANVEAALKRNHQASLSSNFVPAMLHELRYNQVRICRIHVSGDFYSVPYTRAWLQIIRQARQTQFFTYTRSHHVARLRPFLSLLAKERNCQLWLSWDRSMKKPVPMRGARICYLAENDSDRPPCHVDLVFRDQQLNPLKYMQTPRARSLICPFEQGVPLRIRMNCTRCGICWKEQHGVSVHPVRLSV